MIENPNFGHEDFGNSLSDGIDSGTDFSSSTDASDGSGTESTQSTLGKHFGTESESIPKPKALSPFAVPHAVL